MIDKAKFLELADKRLFASNMNPTQRSGIVAILDEWELRKLTLKTWLAYMLATTKWETNSTMQPVREAYWLTENWRRLNLRYYPFYGRGNVQLTWESNYRKMTNIFRKRFEAKYPGFDLVETPDLALESEVSIAIMFEGMTNGESSVGDFTGLSLENFFTDTRSDWVGARKIINGTDHDTEIADIGRTFYACLGGIEALPRKLLRFGMFDPEVGILQRHLGVYYVGKYDNDFGPATYRGVVAFQRAHNLYADGVVGDQTRAALGMS